MELIYFLFFFIIDNNFASIRVHGLKTEKIIGGQDADIFRYKHVVAVMYKPREENMPDQNVCSGAIIHEFFITTAAHCFYNESGEIINKEFYIIVSLVDILHPIHSTRYIRVDLVIVPNYYNSHMPDTYATMGNIAVVKLTEKLKIVPGTRYLRKLKLARRIYRSHRDSFVVAGFGWNNITRFTSLVNDTMYYTLVGQSDGKLRFAIADYWNRRYCENEIIHDTIAEGNICFKIRQAPDEYKGICQGDSGAPLTRGVYLVGIAIHGFAECNENQKPGVYISIPYYYDFIKATLNNTKDDTMRVRQLKQLSMDDFQFEEI